MMLKHLILLAPFALRSALNLREPLDLKLDSREYQLESGWKKFFFGEEGCHTVDFVIENPSGGDVTIDVTDLGCSDDILRVIVNDKSVGLTSLPTSDECAKKEFDPEKAFYDPQWSSLSTTARGDKIKIRFEVEESPYKEGIAAFRVYKMRTKCPLEVNGLTVVNTAVGHERAADACAAFGLELAQVNSQNFNDAANVLFGCLGGFKKAWVASWNGDDYEGAPIAMSIGSWAAGTINTWDESEQLPVLCEGEIRKTKIFLRS